jgi:hypothetical protein
MRLGGRIAAACVMALTVSLGPTTAWATAGGPPPPASCFQADSSGDYPTCTLVDGTWVRGDGVTAHDHLASDAIAGAAGVLLLGVLFALARARTTRSDHSLSSLLLRVSRRRHSPGGHHGALPDRGRLHARVVEQPD